MTRTAQPLDSVSAVRATLGDYLARLAMAGAMLAMIIPRLRLTTLGNLCGANVGASAAIIPWFCLSTGDSQGGLATAVTATIIAWLGFTFGKNGCTGQ